MVVTKKNIRKGNRQGATSCPIALALNDAGFNAVMVRHKFVWCYGNGIFNEVNLPEEAQEFILKFDRGEKVQPFEFELESTLG